MRIPRSAWRAWAAGLAAFAAACWCGATARTGEGGAPAEVRFLEFSGVNQAGNFAGGKRGQWFGWNRYDLAWSQLEPKPGAWDEAEFAKVKERILVERKAGVTLLPMLGYTAPWSQESGPFACRVEDERRVYTPSGDGGKYRVAVYKTNAAGVEERVEEKERDLAPRLAADRVEDWKKFVTRVVRELSAPPYNLRHFQLWNEAHPKSGFWEGDLDAYMERVHVPGAAAVRAAGGLTVYGGWPCVARPEGLVELLDRHKAWDGADVLALHYFSPADLTGVRQAALDRGHDLPVWMTECGFTPDYFYISTHYPALLHDLLADPKFRPDLRKVFYYAWWSPDDSRAYGYGLCPWQGSELTGHGRALSTLAWMFRDDPIRLWDGFAVTAGPGAGAPALKARGFSAGGRRILAVDFRDPALLGKTDPKAFFTVRIDGVARMDVVKAERIGAFGETRDYTFLVRDVGGGITVEAPAAEDPGLAFADGERLPVPPNGLRGVFYLVLHLAPPAPGKTP